MHFNRLALLASALIAILLLADAILLPARSVPLSVTSSSCELSGLQPTSDGRVQEVYECKLFNGEKEVLSIGRCTIRFEQFDGLQFSSEKTRLLGKHKALLVRQAAMDARLPLHLFSSPFVLAMLMVLGLLLCAYPGLQRPQPGNVLNNALSRAGLLFSTGVLIWYLLV